MCNDEDCLSSENVEPQGRQEVCEDVIPDQPSNDILADRTESSDGVKPGDESAVRGDTEQGLNFVECGACGGIRWFGGYKGKYRRPQKSGVLRGEEPRAIFWLGGKRVIKVIFPEGLAIDAGYSKRDRACLVFSRNRPGRIGLARAEWFDDRGAILRFRHSSQHVEYARTISDGLISCLFHRLGRTDFVSAVSVGEIVDGGKTGFLFDVADAEPDLFKFLFPEPEVVSVERSIGIVRFGSAAAVNEAVEIAGDDLGCLEGDTE